jgi:subtilase family serine protease
MGYALCLGMAVGAVPAAPAALKALAQAPVKWVNAVNDLGQVDGAQLLTHLTLIMRRPAQREEAFEALLRDQQDPGSPDFHRWLTPAEVGERFGASDADLATVTAWLRGEGLQVDGISASRTRIRFSGSAARVGAAFGSSFHAYAFAGEKRLALAAAPLVPEAIAPLVQSVHGLSALHERSYEHEGPVAVGDAAQPKSSSCTNGVCTHFIWPGDFAAIYDLNALYQLGIDGSGQAIAVLGRSRVYLPDIENFQKRIGAATKDPVTIVPPGGIDPGPPAGPGATNSKDQSEATLDVTRAGSVAPGATVELIVSAGSATVSGLAVAGEYAVDTSPVPARVVSISFGACEQDAGRSAVQFWDSVFAQAAIEGISVFVSSGDSGIAGCDDHHAAPPDTQVASPNYICSSSHATCVGGTQFNDTANPNAYWRTTNATGFVSALGYIAEGGWNEPVDSSGNFQVAASSGGVSAFIATPSWQTVPGVPGTQGRYTPDVAFSASVHDSYAKCLAATGGDCVPDSTGHFFFSTGSGTSASTPSMAGIAALLDQKMGAPQGNLNPGLYALATSPSNGVFHDVTVATSGVAGCDAGTPSMCNNSTASPTALTGGLAGYLVTPGYDLVTGLGSIDAARLLSQWTSVASPVNYQGLWWASPAGSESGWGINFAHQGDTIFATWFTYDLSGSGNWLVMTAPRTATKTYSGTLYATTGPAFNAVPFDPSRVTATAVGNATLTFSDSNNGFFAYTVGSTAQSKPITREVFGAMPACATATQALSILANYTDLWWASPAGSESGWGINLTHEGTAIFASWFTYDTNDRPMWLVAAAPQTGDMSYSGTLYRTTGPAFNSVPFNPASVVATPVGSVTFTFADGNNATFAYTVNGVSQAKAITREIFGSSGTACY